MSAPTSPGESRTVVRERGIIMTGESVRGILDGRKAQTRRVMVPQPEQWGDPSNDCWQWHTRAQRLSRGAFGIAGGTRASFCRWVAAHSPYGQPGDRLWVRETWADDTRGGTLYAADPFFDGAEIAWNWKPSIHMHRWRSRLTLELTDVRVERVKDITREDAVAEGFGPRSAIALFCGGWDVLNAKRGYDWAANPWVWVLSFRVLPSPAVSDHEGR